MTVAGPGGCRQSSGHRFLMVLTANTSDGRDFNFFSKYLRRWNKLKSRPQGLLVVETDDHCAAYSLHSLFISYKFQNKVVQRHEEEILKGLEAEISNKLNNNSNNNNNNNIIQVNGELLDDTPKDFIDVYLNKIRSTQVALFLIWTVAPFCEYLCPTKWTTMTTTRTRAD